MGDTARLKPGTTTPLVAVTSDVLDLSALTSAVCDGVAGDGAVTSFIGLVRDHNQGRKVSFLEYEAYEPLAVRALQLIIEESKAVWPTARLAVHHRTGRVDIGEASIIIVAASPHRGEAFSACRYMIERVKQIVPIWKHEHFEGGDVWLEGATADPTDDTARDQARTIAGPERSRGACA